MRSLISAVMLASAAAVATPALAQETAPFTGPHVEVLGGYDNIEGDDAFAFGVGAGFDFQVGSFIAGIEGEYMDTTARERASDFLVTGDRFTTNTGRDFYAGVRVGAEVAPGTLLYAKGGYTNAKSGFRYTDPAGNVTRDNNTFDGYRLGAGIEKKFSLFGPSGFIKAEYRYSNYKEGNVPGPNIDVDSDRHQGVVGVGVRF